tara:strand:+ start:299 stop:481 length:183 start_codon:yes stop_codon:yes gene_type:complete
MGKHKKNEDKKKDKKRDKKKPVAKKKKTAKSGEKCSLIVSIFPFAKDIIATFTNYYKKLK